MKGRKEAETGGSLRRPCPQPRRRPELAVRSEGQEGAPGDPRPLVAGIKTRGARGQAEELGGEARQFEEGPGFAGAHALLSAKPGPAAPRFGISFWRKPARLAAWCRHQFMAPARPEPRPFVLLASSLSCFPEGVLTLPPVSPKSSPTTALTTDDITATWQKACGPSIGDLLAVPSLNRQPACHLPSSACFHRETPGSPRLPVVPAPGLAWSLCSGNHVSQCPPLSILSWTFTSPRGLSFPISIQRG